MGAWASAGRGWPTPGEWKAWVQLSSVHELCYWKSEAIVAGCWLPTCSQGVWSGAVNPRALLLA